MNANEKLADDSGTRSSGSATEKKDTNAKPHVARDDTNSRPEIRVTPKEVKKLKTLRRQLKALQARTVVRVKGKRKHSRVCIDSGATLTLLRKQKWLRKLARRIMAVVRTATGERTPTEGHGPISIRTTGSDGKSIDLSGIGEGHLLSSLTYSLLSVSQLCSHGLTVIFKPKEAYMITKDGKKIPFEKHNGLYFLPTRSARNKQGATDTQKEVATLTPFGTTDDLRAHLAESPTIIKKSRKIINMLKRGGYHHALATDLSLNPECVVECIRARHATGRLRRLKHQRDSIKGWAMPMTRSQRAALDKTLDSDVLRPPAKQGGAQATEAPDPPNTAPAPAPAEAPAEQTTARGDDTTRTNPKSAPANSKGKRSRPKPGRKGKKAAATRDRQTQKQRQKEATDMGLELERRIGEARDMVKSATRQLKTAVRENVLLRSSSQAAAADRALARAREWHRIHRKLNHPSKEITDEAYLSGKFRVGKDRGLYKKLPHHTEKYCTVCDQAKFFEVNKPIFQDKQNKERRPGEVWHTDLVGPFPESDQGDKYLITFTCAASNYVFVDTLKKKKHAHHSLVKLQNSSSR